MNPRFVLIRQIIIGIFLVALIVLLSAGIWYGSRVQKLTIFSLDIIGGKTIPQEKLRKIVEEELNGTYYRLVPKRFAWTYPRKAIINRIKQIDRLKNVSIQRETGTKLVIFFEEYTPSALWCENIYSKECLFLDKEGYAFSKAPKLEGSAFIRFIETGKMPEQFSTGFSKTFLEEANFFIERTYNDLNLNIIQIEKTGPDEVTYHISGGGMLKVSLRMNTEDTLKNLTTILNSQEFKHIEPGNFQYIDLRYGNKIFVNEEKVEVKKETDSALINIE